MYGLCQYNKTELAWIFLIFPIIYVIIQNGLLYVHVSSTLQNAPRREKANKQIGMVSRPPLLQQKEKPPATNYWTRTIYIAVSNNSVQLGGYYV